MIRILPYDAAWLAAFEAERARLAAALGPIALRIEHNGSTAVPGLSAKPVIDIQISVRRLQPLDAYARPLAALGYVHLAHADDSFAPFFHRPAEWPHTHHVHVVEAGGDEERRALAFRDYLRAHPEAAREYETLKQHLAARFDESSPASREAYAAAKSAFIERIVGRALQQADENAIRRYYEETAEEERLTSGASQLEFERTREVLRRHLPPPPARLLDVGGAAGAYSLDFAALGYQVHLVDASPRLVEAARSRSGTAAHPIASMRVGDARELPEGNESADVVLLMGPLYHLTDAADRSAALQEAHRVLRVGGFAAVAAISRYASALDGLARNLALDPRFVAIRDRDLRDGQHRNDAGVPDYFTTAYFHTPEGLRAELDDAGFSSVRVVGVEGPAWILPDFERRWSRAAERDIMLDTARMLEAEPSIVGASAHLLGLAWKT